MPQPPDKSSTPNDSPDDTQLDQDEHDAMMAETPPENMTAFLDSLVSLARKKQREADEPKDDGGRLSRFRL